MNRYQRHIQLAEIGPKGQEKLSRAKVLVVGAGGLGCPTLQYLAAAGVGTLGIVDFDSVEESNLQRQILFGTSSLGRNKALAAKERLVDLNPTITIEAYPVALTKENALPLFEAYDIIVDGTDRIETRYLINDAALITDKPIVYGAIYKFEGQLAVFNWKKGATYRCLFPNPPKAGTVASCSEVGVLGVLPGIIGSMQANEVLKIILELPGILTGKLLCYHTQSGQTTLISIPNQSKDLRIRLTKTGELTDDYQTLCNTAVQEITAELALKLNDVLFVDVREPGEQPAVELPNCKHIPLALLEEHMESLSHSGPVVVFCASGVRSHMAIEKLEQKHSNDFYNLTAGATALLQQLKSMA